VVCLRGFGHFSAGQRPSYHRLGDHLIAAKTSLECFYMYDIAFTQYSYTNKTLISTC